MVSMVESLCKENISAADRLLFSKLGILNSYLVMSKSSLKRDQLVVQRLELVESGCIETVYVTEHAG